MKPVDKKAAAISDGTSGHLKFLSGQYSLGRRGRSPLSGTNVGAIFNFISINKKKPGQEQTWYSDDHHRTKLTRH